MTIEIRHAVETAEGAGAVVKRLMPISGFRNHDPFVLWDHFYVAPGAGFPDHPHRGFEAITYLFDGAMQHQDNLGNRSTVTSGGAQRFTAGRGLVHSEMPAPQGTTTGIQLWINLPRRLKTMTPDYQQVDEGQFPVQTIDGGKVKVIVGEGSPLQLQTPICYLDVWLNEGSRLQRPLPSAWRGLVYVVEGQVIIGGQRLNSADACFFEGLDELLIDAEMNSRVMVCVGQPHGEPIHQYGPYVD